MSPRWGTTTDYTFPAAACVRVSTEENEMTRQDIIIATIRTAVPGAIGWALAWLIAQVPVVADVIAQVDEFLVAIGAGVTVQVVLNAAGVALVIAAYYWIVRQLGKRWPVIEAFLLGSSKRPVAYIDPPKHRA